MTGRAQPEELLRSFYRERPRLEAFLVAATRDYHLAQDILQETAISLVRKASEYDTSRPLGPWLRGIARNELARSLRGRSGGVALVDPETLESLAPVFRDTVREDDMRARRAALAECIEVVGGAGRRVLDLRYRERRSCPEIASVIGRTTQAVYAILKRVKEALRKCVEGKLAASPAGEATL